jgi:N-methylhydantoinase B
MNGGKAGSLNGAEVIHRDGTKESYDMCTRVRVVKGDLIRLKTASGGGFGSPDRRPRHLVSQDIKQGYITREQAVRDYGYTG